MQVIIDTNLLDRPTPAPEMIPSLIEELELHAHDAATEILELRERCGRIEDEATAEASSESNADKRKAKRAELLREDAEYAELQQSIREAERGRVQLELRAARLRREFRLNLITREAEVLGRRY